MIHVGGLIQEIRMTDHRVRLRLTRETVEAFGAVYEKLLTARRLEGNDEMEGDGFQEFRRGVFRYALESYHPEVDISVLEEYEHGAGDALGGNGKRIQGDILWIFNAFSCRTRGRREGQQAPTPVASGQYWAHSRSLSERIQKPYMDVQQSEKSQSAAESQTDRIADGDCPDVYRQPADDSRMEVDADGHTTCVRSGPANSCGHGSAQPLAEELPSFGILVAKVNELDSPSAPQSDLVPRPAGRAAADKTSAIACELHPPTEDNEAQPFSATDLVS